MAAELGGKAHLGMRCNTFRLHGGTNDLLDK